jgi:hypothetical protein
MKKTIRIVLIALAAALLLGIAALAVDAATSAGSEDDPLVTLSYINDVFVPYVTSLFRQDLEEKETALQESLEERISALEGAGLAGAGGREYVVETLEAGQTLICQRGAELMLRIGRATVTAENVPGLVDTATTGNLNDGEELTVNHLYMVTINGHGVRAEDTVKILVRGDYTIS